MGLFDLRHQHTSIEKKRECASIPLDDVTVKKLLFRTRILLGFLCPVHTLCPDERRGSLG